MVKYKERRLLMRNPILLFISLLSFCFSAQSSYWQQEIKYDIDVDFNHLIHQFNLSEEITYTNNSPDDLNKVFFHLYYNAFQPGSMMDVRSRTIADPDSRVGNRIFQLQENEIGFQKIISVKENGKNENSIFDDVRQEDLINFGLIPELVGRLPIISSLDILDEEDMLKVLLEPKNSIIKQYQKLFLIEGIVLEFQSSALKAVVKLAMHKKAGARALRSVIEESRMEIMYCIPDMEGVERVTITKDVILYDKEPVYDSGKKRKSA